MELTLTLGIRSAYKRFPYELSVDTLARAVNVDNQPRLAPSLTFDLGKLGTVRERDKSKIDSPGNVSARSHPPTLTLEQRYINVVRAASPPQPSSTRHHETSPIHSRLKTTPGGHQTKVPKYLRNIPSKIKPEIKRDVERFKSPGRVTNSSEEEDRKETRIRPFQEQEKYGKSPKKRSPFELGRTDLPPRPGTTRGKEISIDKTPRSMNSSILIEPRTNKAYVPKLGTGFHRADSAETVGNSVLRLTDKFLSDPFMATFSNQASPRPTPLEPSLWD